MFKLAVITLLFGLASAQNDGTWRQPIDDARCPQRNGVFADIFHRDCHNFIICNDGHAFPFTCPDGSVFNANERVCDNDHVRAGCPQNQWGNNNNQWGNNNNNVWNQDQWRQEQWRQEQQRPDQWRQDQWRNNQWRPMETNEESK